jgi:hypothetical protein
MTALEYPRATKHYFNRFARSTATGLGHPAGSVPAIPGSLRCGSFRAIPSRRRCRTTRCSTVPRRHCRSTRVRSPSCSRCAMGLSAWKQYQSNRWALRVNPSSGNLHPTEAYIVWNGRVCHYAARANMHSRKGGVFRRSGGQRTTPAGGRTRYFWCARPVSTDPSAPFRYCQPRSLGHAIVTPMRLSVGSEARMGEAAADRLVPTPDSRRSWGWIERIDFGGRRTGGGRVCCALITVAGACGSPPTGSAMPRGEALRCQGSPASKRGDYRDAADEVEHYDRGAVARRGAGWNVGGGRIDWWRSTWRAGHRHGALHDVRRADRGWPHPHSTCAHHGPRDRTCPATPAAATPKRCGIRRAIQLVRRDVSRDVVALGRAVSRGMPSPGRRTCIWRSSSIGWEVTWPHLRLLSDPSRRRSGGARCGSQLHLGTGTIRHPERGSTVSSISCCRST